MTAVIAAILAAFLAGAIALYRERRLESRRLRVAARVVQAMLGEALVIAQLVSKGELSWEKMCVVLSREEIAQLWDEHQDVLAGHLSRQEWITVQEAISGYMRIFLAEVSTPDHPGWSDFWARTNKGLKDARQALEPYCG